MTPDSLGILITILAVWLLILGFLHSAHRRAQRICREIGHEWEDGFPGKICSRCGRRA